jgi:hypothetical protein
MIKVHLIDHKNTTIWPRLRMKKSPPYGPPHYNRMVEFMNDKSPPYGPSEYNMMAEFKNESTCTKSLEGTAAISRL